MGQLQKVWYIYLIGLLEEKKIRKRRNIWSNGNFPKLTGLCIWQCLAHNSAQKIVFFLFILWGRYKKKKKLQGSFRRGRDHKAELRIRDILWMRLIWAKNWKVLSLVHSTDAQYQLCGSAGKESTCKEEYLDLIPGLGRSPGEGKGYPLQYLAWRIPWTA